MASDTDEIAKSKMKAMAEQDSPITTKLDKSDDHPAECATPPPCEAQVSLEGEPSVLHPSPEDYATDAVEAATPNDKTDEPVPSDSTEPVEVPLPSGSTDAVEASALSDSTEPVRAPVPSDSTDAVEAHVPSDCTEPIQAPAPSDSAELVGAPVPSDSTESVGAPVPSDNADVVGAPVPSDSTEPVGAPVPSDNADVVGVSLSSGSIVPTEAPAPAVESSLLSDSIEPMETGDTIDSALSKKSLDVTASTESTDEPRPADSSQIRDDLATAKVAVEPGDEQMKPVEEEDMEDGELSDEDEDGSEVTPATSSTGLTTDSQVTSSLTPNASNTDQTKKEDVAEPSTGSSKPRKRNRKSTESSEDQADKDQSRHKDQESSESSSSSEGESRSERKRKKKEKEKRKKEKKQKRKREKQERKKRKRQRVQGDYNGSPSRGYGDYEMYDERWRGDNSMRSPPSQRPRDRGYSNGERHFGDYSYGAGGDGSPSAPDPYASPPDESSEDEFAETLYSLVGDELMDPSVSAAEKEALFKKQQERIPGLSAGKLKKIMKQKQYREQQMRQRQRDSRRRRDDGHGRDNKTLKCRYYAEGKCQKGERCHFSHNFIPAKKMEACKFFLQGYCAKGDMCIYLHSEVPCKYYHTGQKCFNAENCKFSHDPLTDSTKPLLEKAILLEETGTFKAESRPSLLGSPPKEHMQKQDDGGRDSSDMPRVQSFDPEDDDVDKRFPDQDKTRGGGPLLHNNTRIPSILDLGNLRPTAAMQDKLDAGLYDELTAPLSDSEEDRFESPPRRPQTFYSDMLATPNRPDSHSYSSDDQRLSSPNRIKRNRWGPDLPGRQAEDTHMGADFHRNGGGDADRIVPKKEPLLPIPGKPVAPFSQSAAAPNQPPSSTAQTAAVNLSKILHALRSSAAAASSRIPDPRSAPPASDPRVQAMDPRAAPDSHLAAPVSHLADPRNQPTEPVSLGPATYQQRVDPRTGAVANPPHASGYAPEPARMPPPPVTAVIHRPAPEINGKYSRPMDFKLIPVYVEIRTSYIPAGAENSPEMLRDPRIKKRVMSMKKDPAPSLPSLPDITADLKRLQNSRVAAVNAAPIAANRLSSRSSMDGVYNPRRNSIENKHPYKGHGDQNSNNESIPDNLNKPRNAARTALSRVNPMSSGASYNTPSAAHYDEDEEEDNSLTIDMPEDESKAAKQMESVGLKCETV